MAIVVFVLVSRAEALQVDRPSGADAASAASADEPPHPADVATWEILREMRHKPLPPLDEIAPRLASRARGRIATLFDVLVTRRVPGSNDVPPQALSVPQRDLILEAFRRFDRSPVLREARRQVESSDTFLSRASAIRAAGAVGDGDDVAWILALPPPLLEKGPAKIVHLAVEEALAEILRRHPSSHDRLHLLWQGTSNELLASVVRAVGSAGDPRGYELLGDVVSWRAELSNLVFAQVPRIGPSDSHEANAELCDRIRPFLDPEDATTCQAASLALGELGDLQSVEILIELLQAESPGLRSNALWALQRITGFSFPESHETWSVWFAEEMGWARKEKARVVRHLASRDDRDVVEAIRIASRHPLFRHELSEALCGVLSHGRARLRGLACRTLERLSSRTAVIPLVERLDDRDDGVRDSAWSALKGITGRDLPLDQTAWLTALEQ